MRSSKSRSRNKSNRQRTLGNIVNRVFDSSGPEGKVRGTPQQIIEKYLALARDAQLSNDRVAEQSFLQHAEHYTRMLGEAQKEMAERQQFHRPEGEDGRDGQSNGNNGHQQRDNANRDGNRDNGREDYGRDNNRRDNGGRDQREQGGREQGGRDQGARDHNSRDHNSRDQAGRDQPREPFRDQPRPAPEAEPREDERPQTQPEPVAATPTQQPEGLPDAVTTAEDEPAGPVETPEAAAKPARSRAPRAPRGEKPGEKPAAPAGTPRPRRRKSPDGEAAPEGSSAEAPAEMPPVGEE